MNCLKLDVSQCFCLWTIMACTRCLQILICIATVLISINGVEMGQDRLSNVSKMKQRELDYGERLSSMEDDEQQDGLRKELDRQEVMVTDDQDYGNDHKLGADRELLIGKLTAPKKMLQNQENGNTNSTKCTTNKPIQVDANGEIKNSDETTPNQEENTETPINTDTNTTIETTTDNGGDTGKDVIDYNTTISTTPAGSGENRVDLSSGEVQDPSKDNDYDATISTKKYYGAHASYFPDHYLDDA